MHMVWPPRDGYPNHPDTSPPKSGVDPYFHIFPNRENLNKNLQTKETVVLAKLEAILFIKMATILLLLTVLTQKRGHTGWSSVHVSLSK